MKKTIPKVLFVFTERRSETSTWFGGFEKRLQKRPGLDGVAFDHVALEDLIFEIHNNKARIVDVRTGTSIEDYTWAYYKRWMAMPDEAAALAIFLRARGIPFADESVINKNDGTKLVSQFRFWAAGIPVADTMYCAKTNIEYALDHTQLSYPMIVKDAGGQKGKLNFLAHDKAEVLRLVADYPDTTFLIQTYIPNAFDWRIQVYGGRAVVAVKRVGKAGSHLNNESAGGASSFVPRDQVPDVVFDLAERAADAVGLSVSGVDVLPNADQTRYVILEANQGSQIVTGDTSGDQVAIIDEFNKYVARMAKSRIKVDKAAPATPMPVLGLHERIDFMDFGLNDVPAKVDTGAYRSSLHAENIREITRSGKPYVQFEVLDYSEGGKEPRRVTCEAENVGISPVKKATTFIEKRPIIKARIRLGGRLFYTSFTLTNRGSMRYPVLIGRRVLSGRFLVNSALSTKG